MEEMQDIDSIGELRHIDNSENSRGIPDSYLPHSLPYGVHGLPVVWFLPDLNQIELMASLSFGCEREGSEARGR